MLGLGVSRPRPFSLPGRASSSSQSCRRSSRTNGLLSRRIPTPVHPCDERRTRGQFKAQAASTLAEPSGPPAGTKFTAKFVINDARKGLCLKYRFVSRENPDIVSEEYSIQEMFHNHGEVDESLEARCNHEADVTLPADFVPGALEIKKEKSNPEYRISLAEVSLESSDSSISYCVGSNIATEQGWRPFFPDTLTLPAFQGGTPEGLQKFRTSELAAHKGNSEQQRTERKGADRIYGFDVYNDLGSTSDKDLLRPTLGGSEHKYPRRLRTGRPLENGLEVNPDSGKLPWLPLDERFNTVKYQEFQEGAQNSAGLAVRSVVRGILGTPRGYSFLLSLKPFVEKMQRAKIFKNFAVYDSLYKPLKDSDVDTKEKLRELLPLCGLSEEELLMELKDVKVDSSLQQTLLLGEDAAPVNAIIQEKLEAVQQSKANSDSNDKKPKPQSSTWSLFGGRKGKHEETNPEYVDLDGQTKTSFTGQIDVVVRVIKSFLELWPSPRCRFGRSLEWRSDEEFARSFLAGQNPLSIRAVVSKDLDDFAVRDDDLKGLLEGHTLKEALSKKRLFVVDYHPGYIKFVKRVAELRKDSHKSSQDEKNVKDEGGTDSVLYAGRCIFYKRNHGNLMPVAIELETDGQDLRVYTPNNLTEVWFLAKTVIASLDSGIHQLISHWLTTHACVEPYVISTRRELSVLNPLYKLLEPHFRYTLRINCNARAALISAGGIIESCFSPGKFSMELSSNVYASWRFDQQSFPADLLHRGMAEQDGKNLRLLVEDYPYAEDGALVWNAILKFARSYLGLFYKDNVAGERVTDDVEVMKWWESVQHEGHPDIKEGWPKITNVESLAQIAANIMWTASAHHAAVNFGQYDNAAYMPYRPSKIRRKIPTPGSPREAFLRDRFEEEFFSTVSDTISTVLVMATVQILSAHASDEEYLDKDEHRYIKDVKGKEKHKQFLKDLELAEVEINKRNMNQSKRIKQGRGMRYTLMVPSIGQKDVHPSSQSRPPSRGIPYSVSI